AVRDRSKRFLPPLDKNWHLRSSASGDAGGEASGGSSGAAPGQTNLAANRNVGVRPISDRSIDQKPPNVFKPGLGTIPRGNDTIGGGNSSNSGQVPPADKKIGVPPGAGTDPTGEVTEAPPKGSRPGYSKPSDGDTIHLSDLSREAQLNKLADPKSALGDDGGGRPVSGTPFGKTPGDLIGQSLTNPDCTTGRNATSKQDELSDKRDGGAKDGGAKDGGAKDGGAKDGGGKDGGSKDGGAKDGGAKDGGTKDGGAADGGAKDGGATLWWGNLLQRGQE